MHHGGAARYPSINMISIHYIRVHIKDARSMPNKSVITRLKDNSLIFVETKGGKRNYHARGLGCS
jgi:hypothetical protein